MPHMHFRGSCGSRPIAPRVAQHDRQQSANSCHSRLSGFFPESSHSRRRAPRHTIVMTQTCALAAGTDSVAAAPGEPGPGLRCAPRHPARSPRRGPIRCPGFQASARIRERGGRWPPPVRRALLSATAVYLGQISVFGSHGGGFLTSLQVQSDNTSLPGKSVAADVSAPVAKQRKC